MVFGGYNPNDDVFSAHKAHRKPLPAPQRLRSAAKPPFLASHYKPEMEEKIDRMTLVDKTVKLGINALVGLSVVGIVVLFTLNILSFYK